MGNSTLKEDDQLGGAGADVDQAGAEFALVRRDGGLGSGDRLKHGVKLPSPPCWHR